MPPWSCPRCSPLAPCPWSRRKWSGRRRSPAKRRRPRCWAANVSVYSFSSSACSVVSARSCSMSAMCGFVSKLSVMSASPACVGLPVAGTGGAISPSDSISPWDCLHHGNGKHGLFRRRGGRCGRTRRWQFLHLTLRGRVDRASARRTLKLGLHHQRSRNGLHRFVGHVVVHRRSGIVSRRRGLGWVVVVRRGVGVGIVRRGRLPVRLGYKPSQRPFVPRSGLEEANKIPPPSKPPWPRGTLPTPGKEPSSNIGPSRCCPGRQPAP